MDILVLYFTAMKYNNMHVREMLLDRPIFKKKTFSLWIFILKAINQDPIFWIYDRKKISDSFKAIQRQ